MSEQWHRRWLHALEDDTTVPGTPMQVARIYADYAASRGGRWAHVSYAELIRQTHRSRDTIAAAIDQLTSGGWLTPRGLWKIGQEKHYDLTFPAHRPEQSAGRTGRHRRPPARKRSSQPTGSVPATGTVPVRLPDQSGYPTTTSPATGPEAFQPPDHIRLTSFTSLSPRGLHAALSSVVPDVTERETDLIRQLIGRRPGVRSAAAVMRTEIQSGNGPDLVAQVRAATIRPPAPQEHEFTRTDSGWCTCGLPESAHGRRRVPT